MLGRLIGRLLSRRAKPADAASEYRRHLALAATELPGEHYVALLEYLHALLQPRLYVEIGVASGKTLRLAAPATRAIGIDPQPAIEGPLPDNASVYCKTSDAFFAEDAATALGARAIDFAFIDGLHWCEFALRDFMNVERHAAPGAVVALHDCYPLDEKTAARERGSTYWTGDVWRTVLALRRHRPDLLVQTLASPPSGLALVTRLDAASPVLRERYETIVAEMLATDYRSIATRKADALNVTAANREGVAKLVSARAR